MCPVYSNSRVFGITSQEKKAEHSVSSERDSRKGGWEHLKEVLNTENIN